MEPSRCERGNGVNVIKPAPGVVVEEENQGVCGVASSGGVEPDTTGMHELVTKRAFYSNFRGGEGTQLAIHPTIGGINGFRSLAGDELAQLCD